MNRRFYFITEQGNIYVTAWDEISRTWCSPDQWMGDVSQLMFEGYEEISTRTAMSLGWMV